MKKIGINIYLGLLLALLVGIHGFAAELAFIEDTYVDDSTIYIVTSDISEDVETPERMDISLGGQKLDVLDVESVMDYVAPMTYYCLVDVSGSMNSSQMNQAKTVLTEIVAQMNDEDNMVIATLGNQTSTSGYLTDKEEISNVIDGLAAGIEDTNLYAGIVESVRQLQLDEAVNARKCLVILSDGRDDQKTGITKEEADNAIKEASIPVFTVATLKDAPTEAMLEDGKILGSFARTSTGGKHFVPVVEGLDGAQIGQEICNTLNRGLVVTVDTSMITSFERKDVVLLRVIYTAEDGSVYEDTMEMYAEDIQLIEQAVEEATESVVETKAETQESESETEAPIIEDEETNSWIWIVVAAVVVVLLLIIIIAVNKNKKKATAEQADKETPEVQQVEELSPTQPVEDIGPTQAAEVSDIPEGAYELKMFAIGYPDIKFRIVIERGKEMTLGRNDKADVILNPEDKKLSSVHCKVRWENEKLYVWDMNSTNGTFVNGVPIQALGRVAVHDGETIRMGSYEYRIGHPREEDK